MKSYDLLFEIFQEDHNDYSAGRARRLGGALLGGPRTRSFNMLLSILLFTSVIWSKLEVSPLGAETGTEEKKKKNK
jgi:hypothetical protein